jgi:hypothetical protein
MIQINLFEIYNCVILNVLFEKILNEKTLCF